MYYFKSNSEGFMGEMAFDLFSIYILGNNVFGGDLCFLDISSF